MHRSPAAGSGKYAGAGLPRVRAALDLGCAGLKARRYLAARFRLQTLRRHHRKSCPRHENVGFGMYH